MAGSPSKNIIRATLNKTDNETSQRRASAPVQKSAKLAVTERYICPHPDCNKSFTRQEHLSRHKLNHWPKEIFVCPFIFPNTNITCNKTFVRKDLLIRHQKRHTKSKNRLHGKNSQGERESKFKPSISIATNNQTEKNKGALAQQLQLNDTMLENMSTGSSVSSIAPSTETTTAMATPMSRALSTSVSVSPTFPTQIHPVSSISSIRTEFRDSSRSQKQPSRSQSSFSNHNNNNNTCQQRDIRDLSAINPTSSIPPSNNNSFKLNSNIPPTNNNTNNNPQFVSWFLESGENNNNVKNNNNIHNETMSNNTTTTNNNNNTNNKGAPSTNSYNIPNAMSNAISMEQNPGIWSEQQGSINPDPITIPSTTSSTSNLLKMQDLFSVDFLNNDPLQSFLQELSAPLPTNATKDFNNLLDTNNTPLLTDQQQQQHTSQQQQQQQQQQNISANGITPPPTSSGVSNSKAHPYPSITTQVSDRPNVLSSFASEKTSATMAKDRSINQLSPVKEVKLPSFALQAPNTDKQSSNSPTLPAISPSTIKNIESHLYKQKLKSSMKSIPSFFYPDPTTKYNISLEKCNELFSLVPELRYVPKKSIVDSIKSFWLNFHPQYGLLHKPSFHVNKQPPILLLSLIMTGASYLGGNYKETISDPICGPLRWIIFSHPDFQPPSQTYIIQSLLLLEGYEKTSTNRYLHERSYLHHGTTIQLLRRTPSLGGHPLFRKDESKSISINNLTNLEDVYKEWINFETLKRVAFYAFFMDTTHAVVFGYLNLFITFNQIQLTLPYPDKIWESYDLSYEKLVEFGLDRGSTGNDSFSNVLKGVLNRAITKLQNHIQKNASYDETDDLLLNANIQSVFSKRIILAGIISIMLQLKEEEKEDTFTSCNYLAGLKIPSPPGLENRGISWKEIISFTLDYWLINIQGDCTELAQNFTLNVNGTDDSEDNMDDNSGDEDDRSSSPLNLILADTNSTCKLPVYHMSQVFLRIFHHDYYIYAGAPWRMNVRIGEDEYQLISTRILNFAKDPSNGGVAIVYAFQFLFQMFIDKANPDRIITKYDVNSEYCITRPNTMALTSLLIWCHNFVLYGPECNMWDNSHAKDQEDQLTTAADNNIKKEAYRPIETFEEYLTRMYRYLYVSTKQDVIDYQKEIWNKAQSLSTLEGNNNLCGMMFFMRELFADSYWDLGKEFSRLFDNCFERSLGRVSPTCYNMYDAEL
ncbi:hypothetical protein NCAS_0B04500 [Naumovozyma castellii]|uniref:C2H2-type domain-containing protein n=1 Tax=Naumovozyma castellii TaxID=27288 RepID=G0VAK8_NAUCA|nr:hypothetical protein NCAS_0B04500 [Naumovozyma castellii CBS 4309]CCC68534.1 hypothetical protein NCAS_0B04500 [Naumovozyma castellii CBS 4309]